MSDNHQRQGIGTLLVSLLVKKLKEHFDVKVITVNSSPYAKQAYEKVGFRIDGEMQVDNGM